METQNLQTLTAEQFADFIGVKIGTVYKWKSLQKLPTNIYRKVGNRKLIFIKNFVDEWINNGAQLNQSQERRSKNE